MKQYEAIFQLDKGTISIKFQANDPLVALSILRAYRTENNLTGTFKLIQIGI